MSEKYNSKTHCMHCNRKSDIEIDTSCVHIYAKQPWFSWVEFACTKCNKTNSLFFGPQRWQYEIRGLVGLGIFALIEEFPPEHMVELFEEMYDVHPPSEVWVSPRRLREAEFFAYLLDRGEMPWTT